MAVFVMARQTKRGGRTLKYRGGATSPHSVRVPDTMWTTLEERRAAGHGAVNEQIVDALQDYLEEKMVVRRLVPCLGSVPCGPLREALAEAELVDLGDLYERLGVKDEDFLLTAAGVSMEGDEFKRHGIGDGDLILFRPYLLPQNEPALLRYEYEDGRYEYTCKYYVQDGRTARVTDGQGNTIPTPSGVASITPVAVAKNAISASLDLSDAKLQREIRQLRTQLEEYAKTIESLKNAPAAITYPPEFEQVARDLDETPDTVLRAMIDTAGAMGAKWTFGMMTGEETADATIKRLTQTDTSTPDHKQSKAA